MSGKGECVDCGKPASVIIDAEPLCGSCNVARGKADEHERFPRRHEAPEAIIAPLPPQPCPCGCGQMPNPGKTWVHGHFGKKPTPEKLEVAERLIQEGISQAAVAAEVGVSQATICNLKDRKGRKPGDTYKNEQRADAARLLKQGESTRAVAEAVGLSQNTVLNVRAEVAAELPEKCACGEPLGHKGWCAPRLSASPARQETVKMLHERRHTTEVSESVSLEMMQAEPPPEWATLPPAPTGQDASLDSSNEWLDGKNTTECVNLHLQSGGSISLHLWDIKLFTMSPQDHEFLVSLIASFRHYAALHPKKPLTPP